MNLVLLFVSYSLLLCPYNISDKHLNSDGLYSLITTNKKRGA